MASVDTTVFLDVNRLARRTMWAHGFMRLFAGYIGLALLALLVAAAFNRARGGWPRPPTVRVAAVLWIPVAALAAFGLGLAVCHIVGRIPPYDALTHAELLVPKAHGFSLPSGMAAVAGAVATGLWLARDYALAVIATLDGLALAFSQVYVGAHYPGDVVAGLGLGLVVAAVGYVLAGQSLEALVESVGRGRLGALVGVRNAVPLVTSGPASRPPVLAATGTVRVIESSQLGRRLSTTLEGGQGEKLPSS
jgi:undecaprenyl-diphosphatase